MKVIVYTLETCRHCRLVIKYLDEEKVAYTIRDAEMYNAYLRSKGFCSVPILEIDGTCYPFSTLSQIRLILREHAEPLEEIL